MKRTSTQKMLEPALKRFQRLPHLSAGRPLKAFAAPHSVKAPRLMDRGAVRLVLPPPPLATRTDPSVSAWTLPA
jgi:hypothetical protein